MKKFLVVLELTVLRGFLLCSTAKTQCSVSVSVYMCLSRATVTVQHTATEKHFLKAHPLRNTGKALQTATL